MVSLLRNSIHTTVWAGLHVPGVRSDNPIEMCALLKRVTGVAVVFATTALAGCASHTAPRVLPPAGTASLAIARTAEALVGAPYRNGGADPAGFDCSGFVRYVYARNGMTVPRDVRRQWQTGLEIRRGDVRPGDLLFFATTGPGPTHVSIALDRHRFVHAPSSRGLVRVESLAASYWSTRFVGARRMPR